MNSHWPILAGILMVAAAVGLGLWQREATIGAAAPQALVAPSAPVVTEKPVATAPKTTTPAPAVNSAAPTPNIPNAPAPNAMHLPVTKTTTPALVQPNANPAAATPAQPANKPKRTLTLPSNQPAPAATQPQPAAAPELPAVRATPAAPAAANEPNEQQKVQALLDLRAALQNKLGVLAADLPNKSFFVNLDGARIEVQPAPNWTISIFNINPRTPETETENFKRILDAVVTSLKIDTKQPVTETPNQKKFQKTTSVLGTVTVVRDLANGNSATIRPVEIRAAQPVAPAAPAQPAQPVQPGDPKAKGAGDGNF